MHLAPSVDTNVLVLNGLLNLIIEAGQIDQGYIDAQAVGFEMLKATVAAYPPEHVRALSGVPEEKLRAAAEILSTTQSLVTTALQGVYQSMQATTAACQINNLPLEPGTLARNQASARGN